MVCSTEVFKINGMVKDLKLFREIVLITCSVVEKDTFLTRFTS